MIKTWYSSRTIWVNVLTLAVSIITVLMSSELLAGYENLILILTTIVVPIINIILRWLTDQPVTSVFKAMDKLPLRRKINIP